jgi:hypothetical protein
MYRYKKQKTISIIFFYNAITHFFRNLNPSILTHTKMTRNPFLTLLGHNLLVLFDAQKREIARNYI